MRQAGHVTIAEVAAKAGTSSAAVSFVMNNRPGLVGDDKRRRILEAADQLGYRPNRRARQLRKQANLVISIQIDSSIAANNSWRATAVLNLLMVQGINSCAAKRGYHLHLIVPAAGCDHQEINDQVLAENAVDGVVLMGLTSVDDAQRGDIIAGLRRCRVPAVTLDRRIAAEGVPRVSVDLQPAIEAAAARISALGHRRIGYIGTRGSQTLSEWIGRFELFDRALDRHGTRIAPRLVIERHTEIEAYEATAALLDHRHPPTCIIYAGDHLAMAGAQAILRRDLKPGRDVSLVSFGNAPYAAESPVPLAAIDQHHHEQGATLGRVLLDQIDHPKLEPPAVTLVRSQFIERASLGPARET